MPMTWDEQADARVSIPGRLYTTIFNLGASESLTSLHIAVRWTSDDARHLGRLQEISGFHG